MTYLDDDDEDDQSILTVLSIKMTMKMNMTNMSILTLLSMKMTMKMNMTNSDRSISPDSNHLWRKASHMWTVCVIKMILKVMEVDRLCYSI